MSTFSMTTRFLFNRLEWYTKGWHPHQPVPGSMLVFELHATPAKINDQPSRVVSESRKLESATATEEHASWRARGESRPHRDDDSRFYIKLYFVAASPAQIRNGDKLGPENVSYFYSLRAKRSDLTRTVFVREASRPCASHHPVVLGGDGHWRWNY